MSLRIKLVIIVGSMSLSFFLVFALFYYSNSVTNNLNKKMAEIQYMNISWNRIELLTKELLIVKFDIGNVFDAWQKAVTDFNNLIRNFSDDSRLLSFDSVILDKLKIISDTWNSYTLPRIEVVKKHLLEMFEKKNIFDRRNGNILMYMGVYMERTGEDNLRIFDNLKNLVEQTRETITALDAFGSSFVFTTDQIEKNVGQYKSIINVVIPLVILLIIILSLTGIIIFSQQLVKPLKLITSTAGGIAMGNLNVSRIAIKSRDELGFLAQVFNGMIDHLNRLSAIASDIADGKIGYSIPEAGDGEDKAGNEEFLKGDIGKAFSKMISNLKEIVFRIKEMVILLNSNVREIEQKVSEQTTGTDTQASGMGEISTTLEELVISARQIMRNTGELVLTSGEMMRFLQESEDQLKNITGQLEDVVRISFQNTEEIYELRKKSQIINDMVDIIKDVANKTNILSVNASIEAAQSGQSGTGFAVVASEIRQLSKETIASAKNAENAARDINALLKAIAASSEKESTRIMESSEIVKSIYGNVGNIMQRINNNYTFTREIDESIKQQESGSGQAADTIRRMAEIARHSAESARHILTYINEILKLGENLEKIVDLFRIDSDDKKQAKNTAE